ncbi:butyrophilin-like protein 10 [Genypterus blacodes]|uniref:butyrophilin-like protein 10 n=1 Tax=Genypterus blacodes TaxID=154954 RepID=UPI003F775BFC
MLFEGDLINVWLLYLSNRFRETNMFLLCADFQNSRMLHRLHGLFSKTQFESFCVLVFHLSLLPSCRGQSQLIGPPQPIVAKLGDDIVLPCLLEPATDSAGLTLEWSKPDMRPRYVFVWREKEELLDIKHPSYMGRASMFMDELKHGNISLKISKAKLSDEGRYRCFIPTLKIDTFVDLVVGVVSSPLIRLSGIDTSSSAVMLECESAGWYPEPEMLWLDAEGNIVSAGPTETLRGPDGLYNVSSSVTVDNKHGNTFTCKLRQNKTNQTRDTQIHVPGDFFMVQSCPAVFICIGLAVGMFALLLSFVVWKLKNPRKTKKEHRRN